MSLREDVAALAAMDRLSATEGERRSADWCAARLREAGAQEVEVRPFRYSHTFGHAQALLFAAAALGRLPAAKALALFELDYSGRAQPLRRVLPAGEGANVVARLPARGERRSTVILVAHHDAAHTGWMWRLAAALPGREHGAGSFAALPELAMAAIAVGPRRLRRPARAVLALSAALALQVSRGPVVPGAGDNATGVAAAIALAERFAADPPHHTEVVVVLPGAEESGMGGMRAWLDDALPGLDPGTTFVIGLDTLGAGEPMVAASEGPLWAVSYGEEDLAVLDAAARRVGEAPPRRFRVGGWTDPVLARLEGLRAVSLLSLRGNGFNDYHLPSDVPGNVDWESVDRCVALADAAAREFAER